ncbi:MAG: hypothetical protein J1F37_03965 [Oscillospiraceae bacterium]|nr:hypothetical protein [Oscillospiraceae bacterium]
MKKLIAVLVALAMVLSMSVMAFAAFNGVSSPAEIVEDPDNFNAAVNNPLLYVGTYAEIMEQGIYTREDGSLMNWDEAWQAYYLYVLSGATSDPGAAIGEIVAIVSGGYIDAGTAITMAGEALMGGAGGDGESGDLSSIVDQIMGAIGGIGGDAEPEVSAEEYAQELADLINNGASFEEIRDKIRDDINSGKIVVSQLPDIATALSELVEVGEIEDNETVKEILAFFEGFGGEGDGGFQFPDFGDFTLPWDNDNSSSGSFLDTILGILGTIGDLLFGGGDGEGGDDPGYNWGGDDWGNGDDGNDWGNGDNTTVIPNTGDVSFIAVAAVAAVAGAALILTRKKSDDAE